MTSVKVFATGTIKWAKIVGKKALVQNYEKDGREWTFQFHPDDTAFLKDHKLLDRLKDKGDEEGPYLIIKKPEFDKNGEENAPFRIYDGTGEEQTLWDDRLIGNGSKADIKLDIRDWGVGKKKSIYATAIRVTDLVPYVSDEFAGMTKTATKAKAPKPKTVLAELDDLEDELPM